MYDLYGVMIVTVPKQNFIFYIWTQKQNWQTIMDARVGDLGRLGGNKLNQQVSRNTIDEYNSSPLLPLYFAEIHVLSVRHKTRKNHYSWFRNKFIRGIFSSLEIEIKIQCLTDINFYFRWAAYLSVYNNTARYHGRRLHIWFLGIFQNILISNCYDCYLTRYWFVLCLRL